MQRTKGPARGLSFPLGEVVVTLAAQEWLTPAEVRRALDRHAQGDWGDLDPEDWVLSDHAVVTGKPAVSVHTAGDGIKFGVITGGSRKTTMVMLPERYENACMRHPGKNV